MGTNNKKTSGGGVGFLVLLTLLFIALKLLGKVNWSWWQVLAPLWIPTVALVIVLIIIAFLQK